MAEESKSRRTSNRQTGRRSRSTDENSTNGTQDTESTPSERAEEVVDRLSKRFGDWMNAATMQAVIVYARMREEAEDIWAEAQNIRRKGRS